jgi:hypothetical protein
MITIKVFEPAMCCATGVCGSTVDPQLTRFASDIAWLKSCGIEVHRFNLAQHPEAFARDAVVTEELGRGLKTLPLVFVNGHLRSRGKYPTRQELAEWGGISPSGQMPVIDETCSGGQKCC